MQSRRQLGPASAVLSGLGSALGFAGTATETAGAIGTAAGGLASAALPYAVPALWAYNNNKIRTYLEKNYPDQADVYTQYVSPTVENSMATYYDHYHRSSHLPKSKQFLYSANAGVARTFRSHAQRANSKFSPPPKQPSVPQVVYKIPVYNHKGTPQFSLAFKRNPGMKYAGSPFPYVYSSALRKRESYKKYFPYYKKKQFKKRKRYPDEKKKKN